MSVHMKSLFWEAVHQVVAHPLLFVTRDATWATSFHDWTAIRAWGDR